MAVSHSLKERIENAALDPEIGIRQDPCLPCNLICQLKSHAGDIICQLVRIFLYNGIQSRPILLVDFHRQIHGNPIILKKHHGLTHLLFLFHLPADIHGHLFTDALYLGKPLRLLLHDAEGVRLEPAHDPGC